MRLIDRMLGRQGGYNEAMYSGAYTVSGYDPAGQGREKSLAGVVQHARDAYGANGIVFGCVALRMGLFSEARFQFQSMSDMHLYGSPELTVLEHPWPNGDTGDLLKRLEQDGGSLAGNCYIRKVAPAGGGDPVLVRMRPDCVTIVSEERTDDMGRTYRVPVGYEEDMRPAGLDSDPQFYAVDEVAHFAPLPDPLASWRGMSWLTPVLRDVRADDALTRYRIWHLDNGAMPGLVIKASRKLSDAAIQTLRTRLSARYAGPENAGKTIVLDEGQDVTVAGSTLDKLQFDAVTKAGERRICSAAQVPLEIMGLETGDYTTAVRKLADLWARPHWRMACAALQHLVPGMPPQGVRLWYDVSGIAALREGELVRSQATLVRAQAVQSFVAAGFTRVSAIAAANSGDISQLVPDPNAPTPGVMGRETATEHIAPGGSFGQTPGPAPGGGAVPQGTAGAGPGGGPANGRAPQAGRPQALPGVVSPRLPNALPFKAPVSPAIPNGGPRGPGGSAAALRAFNPAEPRDAHGRWGHGASAGVAAALGNLSDEGYQAHTAAIERTIGAALAAGQATDAQYATDVAKGLWQPARARIQKQIVNDLYSRAARGVPSDGEAVIAGGLGGAGKSTVLGKHAGIDPKRYITLNPDDVKEEMARRGLIPKVAGLSPMESSALVHEESSHIANLIAKRAYADRKNVIWDITMSSRGSVQRRLAELKAAGYGKIRGVFVDIPVETSVQRALARHRLGLGTALGGRYVPPAIIRSNASSHASSANREVFDSLRGQFDGWSLYDNSGSAPKLVSSSQAGRPRSG